MSRVFKVDYIPDPDRGRPLWNAKIYVGIPNEDPTIPSNQIQLTGDIGFPVGQSIPVPQPVRTNKGGVTVYNNSPLDLNAPGQQYAIAIYDRNDNLIYNFPQVDGSVAMNTTSQEEVTGLTIWPEIGEAVIGQTIPAGTDAIRYPFDGRSTLFTIKPTVAVSGPITDISINTSGIGTLEVDNSDVYDLAEFNSFIAANDGDSQLAGGAIWPLSSQDSAQVGDAGLSGVIILSDGMELYDLNKTVSGDITALDFNALTATIGGENVTMVRRVNVRSFDLISDIPTGLKVGDRVETKGAVQVGLGSNEFVVQASGAETPDGWVIIDMLNGNYAYRLKKTPLRIEEFGGLPETDASVAIRAMANNPLGIKVFNLNPFNYFWDGLVLQFPEESTINANGTKFTLNAGSYTANTYCISNVDVPNEGINYVDDVTFPMQRSFTVNGLEIDGNKDNVTTNASCNGIHLYKTNGVNLESINVHDMAGTIGGQPGIITRYCQGAINNPIVRNTDRQNISIWESLVDITNFRGGESYFREPILVSSENPPDFRGSVSNISEGAASNTTTVSGTHVIRFSGKSSGSVKHMELFGKAGLSAMYITDTQEHNITLFDNDYYNCERGLLIESSSAKEINSLFNRYHDCADPIRAVAGFVDGTLNIMEDKATGVTGQPLNIDFVANVNVTNFNSDGGNTGLFIGNYETLDFVGNEVKNNTDANQAINIDAAAAGANIPHISGNSGTGNTNNRLRISEPSFVNSNEFIISGPGVPIMKIGNVYQWTSTTNTFRIGSTIPTNATRDTEGAEIATV